MNFIKYLKSEIGKYIEPRSSESSIDKPLTARQLLNIVDQAEKLDERDATVVRQNLDNTTRRC